MFKDIAEVKAANKAAGSHFFSPNTMRFFNSIIESSLYKNQCFITSEKPPHGPRIYRVRKVKGNDGSIIDSIGPWLKNIETARTVARAGEWKEEYTIRFHHSIEKL
jgi:hypothetical protein